MMTSSGAMWCWETKFTYRAYMQMLGSKHCSASAKLNAICGDNCAFSLAWRAIVVYRDRNRCSKSATHVSARSFRESRPKNPTNWRTCSHQRFLSQHSNLNWLAAINHKWKSRKPNFSFAAGLAVVKYWARYASLVFSACRRGQISWI
jgi:hypothetical protein